METKAKTLGAKGWGNLSEDDMEYVQGMDGAEYSEFKRERMETSGIGAMLERFEQIEKGKKK